MKNRMKLERAGYSSPTNTIPEVMTMMMRIMTPIFIWHLGHIPDGVGFSPRGHGSLHSRQVGAGVDSADLDLMNTTYETGEY